MLDSVIRTGVPYIIGVVVAYLTTKGINVDENTKVQLTGVLTFVIGIVYYAVVRALEAKFPQLGYLLGVAKQPVYAASKTAYTVPDTTAGIVNLKVKETK